MNQHLNIVENYKVQKFSFLQNDQVRQKIISEIKNKYKIYKIYKNQRKTIFIKEELLIEPSSICDMGDFLDELLSYYEMKMKNYS